jgi:hypothetical protein
MDGRASDPSRNFSFRHYSGMSEFRPYSASHPMGTEGRSGWSEVVTSPACMAEVKNAGSLASTPSLSIFMIEIGHVSNFTHSLKFVVRTFFFFLLLVSGGLWI